MKPGPKKMPHTRRREATNGYQGLTMWTPTVNIYRDPRWGEVLKRMGKMPYPDKCHGGKCG